MYEHYKCFLQYVTVSKNDFILSIYSVKKKTAFSSEFFISKFSDLFDYFKKDLGKFVLLLRRSTICCKYSDSLVKFKDKSLSPKEIIFIELISKGISGKDYTCTHK